jgi:hypothetical protein
MANRAYQNRIESPRGVGHFSSGLFVAIAGTFVATALCLLPVLETPHTILPDAARWALIVILIALGFAGVVLSTLLNLSDTRRLTLVLLFATALLCSGFAALMGFGLLSVERLIVGCESRHERKSK